MEKIELTFPLDKTCNYILLHGFTSTPESNFFPTIKKELEAQGNTVHIPALPNTNNPSEEQVDYVIKNTKFDKNTILLGHSLGAVVALKVLEKIKTKIAGLVLVGGFLKPTFKDKNRPFEKKFIWQFDFNKIKDNVGFVKILSDKKDYAIPTEQGILLAKNLDGDFTETTANEPHFTSTEEPVVRARITPSIIIPTSRPDLFFAITFILLPNKTAEKITGKKQKVDTFTNLYATHPETKEQLPIWAANIQEPIAAAPAHDKKMFQFAKTHNLPIRYVISKDGNQHSTDKPFTDDGILFNSRAFSAMYNRKAIPSIITWLEKSGFGKRVQ